MPKLSKVEKREVEIKEIICKYVRQYFNAPNDLPGPGKNCTPCRKLARKIIKKLGLEISDWPNNVR